MLDKALWGNERGESEEREGFWIWLGHLSCLVAGGVGGRKGALPSIRCGVFGRESSELKLNA